MNERMVNYKCENCGAIGELNEYYDFLQCPQCQGKMLPLNSLDELMSSDFVPPNLDDDATISISREFIPKSHKGVKVAAAVDIGFGGMLSSSITGKYSPLTSSQDKTEQTRFAPPPPPKPAPTHNTPKYQPSTTTKNRPATTGRHKAVSKSKKSFTIHKKKKQSKKHTGSYSPATTSSSRPVSSRSVTKTSMRIKPVKKKTARSPHPQTNHYPTMVAEEEPRAINSGMEQTQQELQIPKEVYQAPLPQEEPSPVANFSTAETVIDMEPDNQDLDLNIESIVNDINSGKIAKDPNTFVETTPQEQKQEVEQPPKPNKPRIATAVGIKPQTKQAEEPETLQKPEEEIKPQPVKQAVAAPVQPKKAEPVSSRALNEKKQEPKKPAPKKHSTPQGKTEANKPAPQKKGTPQTKSGVKKSTPQKLGNPQTKTGMKKSTPQKPGNPQGKTGVKKSAQNSNQKNAVGNPGKKSTLPPPKGKKTTNNSQTKTQNAQQTKQGKPQAKNKRNANNQNNKIAKKPQTGNKNPKASANEANNKKPASSTQQGQQQNPNANPNENNGNEPIPLMTRTQLIRLQMAKKKQIKIILGVIMGVVALIVFILTKACMSAMTSTPKRHKKVRVNANSNVGKYYSNRSSSSGAGYSPRPTVERSGLYKDFMALKRKTKKMPQSSADQIDDIINMWEQFVDDHASESSAPEYDKALKHIENLKETKKMYTEGFGL